MPILEKIMADATNSSLTEVKIINADDHFCDISIPVCDTAITFEIRPRDRNHEKYVISKMNLTNNCLNPPWCLTPPCICKSFLVNELNLRLQNLTTENDLSFPYQSHHYVWSLTNGNALFYNSYNSLS